MAATVSSLSSPLTIGEAALFGGLAKADDASYIRQLTSYSIGRLEKEPRHLSDEQSRVQRDMETLAVDHYRSFVESSRAVHAIHTHVTTMDQKVEALVTQLPLFTDAVATFVNRSDDIRKEQKLNRLMSENWSQLLEILELPQLMDSCVRNGLYEEALDLEAYARSLHQRHATIPILHDIVTDMNMSMRTVLHQLLQLLRSQIQLSKCLRVVGYLRRMDVFDEHALRTEFLRCRNAYLEQTLAAIPATQSNPYDYLTKYLDANRVQIFDVITQYRAIFIDDSSAAEDLTNGDRGLLFYWVGHRINAILSTLTKVLPTVKEGSFLSAVVEQSMYCGASLSRVGLDFRGLLPPLFEKCVIDMFQSAMNDATAAFQQSLNIYEWHIDAKQLIKLGIPVDAHGPLLEYPPLATLVNSFISAFNNLRHCAPLSVKSSITAAVERTLMDIAQKLHKLKILSYTNTNALDDGDRDPLVLLARAMVDHALPMIARLLTDVFHHKSRPSVSSSSSLLDTSAISASLSLLYVSNEEERTATAAAATAATTDTKSSSAATKSATWIEEDSPFASAVPTPPAAPVAVVTPSIASITSTVISPAVAVAVVAPLSSSIPNETPVPVTDSLIATPSSIAMTSEPTPLVSQTHVPSSTMTNPLMDDTDDFFAAAIAADTSANVTPSVAALAVPLASSPATSPLSSSLHSTPKPKRLTTPTPAPSPAVWSSPDHSTGGHNTVISSSPSSGSWDDATGLSTPPRGIAPHHRTSSSILSSPSSSVASSSSTFTIPSPLPKSLSAATTSTTAAAAAAAPRVVTVAPLPLSNDSFFDDLLNSS